VVKKYEGYIEKFAGDALLALYGAPVAHEDDAARAILTALDMHRELGRVAAELPREVDLALHVGVNSGHGIGRILDSTARTDYAVLGDCVILAQRLESAAPRGETYASELTVELTRDRFDFEPVGELALKGKSTPVAAWRLVGERRRRVARWARTERPLVGRDDELRALADVFDRTARGRGGVVTVIGEAGIGKSRLVEEARARAARGGIRWLDARCLPYGSDLAYWPYAELIREVAGIRAEDAAANAVQRVSAAFAACPQVVPYFLRTVGLPLPAGDDVARLEPEEFRRRLHEAFATWLSALAAERPTVVSIEDIHWADPSTLDLTAALASLTSSLPLVLCLIGRHEASTGPGKGPPDSLDIELAPLTEAQIELFLEAILEGHPPRKLADIVRAHTEGNPFFVEELVRSMRETSALDQRNGVWRLRPGWEPDQLPLNVEGVLAERIDLLPVRTAEVLQTASVIGRRVRLPLLAAVDASAAGFDGPVAQLVAGGFLDLLDEEGQTTLVFHHALVQDVAYSQLLRRRRRELHLRVADVAERMYGAGDDTVDLLARHLYLGGAGERAVPYLVRAGGRAKALFANDAAIVHFARASEIAPADHEVRLHLGELHELVGSYADALRHYDWVRERADDVRAWRGAAATLRKTGDYERALMLVHTALVRDDLADHDLTPLWLEDGWILSVMGEFGRAAEALQTALGASRGRRDPNVAQLLLQLAVCEARTGAHERALEHALDAERICEEHDDLRSLAKALRVVGASYWYVDRLDEAAAALTRALVLAERVGSAEEMGACLMNSALVAKAREDYSAAAGYERRAIVEFERAENASGRAQAYANLADTLELSGRLEEARQSCEQSLELARAVGYPVSIADATYTLACIERKLENFAAAAESAEEAAGLFSELGTDTKAREMLDLAAEAWASVGEDERARACSARARELAAA
jgi:adenylate cyclase